MSHPVRAKATRSWYTVVGVYTDNWRKFCQHVLALNAQNARNLVRNNKNSDDDLVIVAVFEGKHTAVDQGEIANAPSAEWIPRLDVCWFADRLGADRRM